MAGVALTLRTVVTWPNLRLAAYGVYRRIQGSRERKREILIQREREAALVPQAATYG